MRAFRCRSRERKRARHNSDADCTSSCRSSGLVGTEFGQNLVVPGQTIRWKSLTNLSEPERDIRRRSYSGPFNVHNNEHELMRLPVKSLLPDNRQRLNPVMMRLSNECVSKVFLGMILIFIIVLLVSLYRLLT